MTKDDRALLERHVKWAEATREVKVPVKVMALFRRIAAEENRKLERIGRAA